MNLFLEGGGSVYNCIRTRCAIHTCIVINLCAKDIITNGLRVYIVSPKRADCIQKRIYSDLFQDKSAELFCTYLWTSGPGEGPFSTKAFKPQLARGVKMTSSKTAFHPFLTTPASCFKFSVF